jgi:hypothetical protein
MKTTAAWNEVVRVIRLLYMSFGGGVDSDEWWGRTASAAGGTTTCHQWWSSQQLPGAMNRCEKDNECFLTG